MAEESDLEKTEEATPRRLEKAREEGQVARSQELTTFALLMIAGGGFVDARIKFYYELNGNFETWPTNPA